MTPHRAPGRHRRVLPEVRSVTRPQTRPPSLRSGLPLRRVGQSIPRQYARCRAAASLPGSLASDSPDSTSVAATIISTEAAIVTEALKDPLGRFVGPVGLCGTPVRCRWFRELTSDHSHAVFAGGLPLDIDWGDSRPKRTSSMRKPPRLESTSVACSETRIYNIGISLHYMRRAHAFHQTRAGRCRHYRPRDDLRRRPHGREYRPIRTRGGAGAHRRNGRTGQR